jgi:hypothetical protein
MVRRRRLGRGVWVISVCPSYIGKLPLYFVHLLLGEIFKVDEAIAGLLGDANQLIDLQLQSFGISVLCVLDQEHHQVR